MPLIKSDLSITFTLLSLTVLPFLSLLLTANSFSSAPAPVMISRKVFLFFMVKPKRGHSNNTQGHWWEPPSLPVIFHLLATVNDSHRDGAGS